MAGRPCGRGLLSVTDVRCLHRIPPSPFIAASQGLDLLVPQFPHFKVTIMVPPHEIDVRIKWVNTLGKGSDHV